MFQKQKTYLNNNAFYNIIACALLFWSTSALHAQIKIDSGFITKVKEITSQKPSSYQYIDSTFLNVKRDSIKMTYLSAKSKEANYLEGESYALNMLGITYRNTSLYDKAITIHSQAKNLATEANNTDLKVISLNMLGVVYRRLDLIRGALDYHKQALDLAETVENPSKDLMQSIAVSQNSMGNIYLVLKQYDLALNQFNNSIFIEKRLNNKLGLAINYQNIGFAKEAKGQLNEALINYETSLGLNNEIDSELGRVICYNSIGKVYIKQGRFKDALRIITDAFNKALELNDQYYIATSYLNLGWVQLKLDNLSEAENNLKIALKIAEDYNFKTSEIEAYEYLSELHEVKGNYKTSMAYYKKFIELDGTITNERNLQYVNDLVIKYESEKKNNQITALASENEIVKLKLAQNRKTLWFSLLGGLLFLGILIVLNRQGHLKSEKQIVTLEQEMLRNQMNPHFIFNSLNSIKLYIINNEKENAVYYLNKFSKLIRKILVSSTEKEISLDDELETMALYMNIENIRFDNEIKYEVNINKNVNTGLIKVPSLILQPFLENALWHGLSSKDDDKKVILNIAKNTSDFITITITDNGIGRAASKAIKKQKTLKRKSVGIAITKERLENFSKQFSNNYVLKIIDLYDHNNKALGTKVVINIPVNEVKLKTA